MSTITAILEPSADGTLHLPVPLLLRGNKVKVVATLEAVVSVPERVRGEPWQGFGSMKGMITMTPDFDEPLDDFREYME